MNMFYRATVPLDLDFYRNTSPSPIKTNIPAPKLSCSMGYVLRMPIKMYSGRIALPDKYKALYPFIINCVDFQAQYFLYHHFIYLTIRCGPVTSITDDEWHVDGFSMRTVHRPEQNYIWVDHSPTEWLDQNIPIPRDFDPLKHNIHTYFQQQADSRNVKTFDNAVYVIDPYVIHRRPRLPLGTVRMMIRLSFVPIEIEDDTCTDNPLIPRRQYGNTDIRTKLIAYDAVPR